MRNMGATSNTSIGQMLFTGRVVVTILFLTLSVFGQNYEGDARKIGMGGTGESDNLASKAMDEGQGDRSIVLPLKFIPKRTLKNPTRKFLTVKL